MIEVWAIGRESSLLWSPGFSPEARGYELYSKVHELLGEPDENYGTLSRKMLVFTTFSNFRVCRDPLK